MITVEINESTPVNMLRAIRAACNELLGEPHADLTTQAANHVSRANELQAAADAEAHKAAAALSAHNATEVAAAWQEANDVKRELAEMLPAENVDGPAIELDSAGQPWNAELHASTKTKNADGTWKKRRSAAQAATETVAQDDAATLVPLPSAPPVPPAPAAEPIMPKIFALITSQIVTINQAVEAAQAEGFADLGANGLGGAPREAQEAVLRKLEG